MCPDPGGHRMSLYEVWVVFGFQWDIGGLLYEVWELYGDVRGHRVSFI